MNYQLDIPSLHTINPDLPLVINNIDLNRDIHAQTPINLSDLDHAKAVVDTLRGEQGQNPVVTPAVVRTAELRVGVIEHAHASGYFGPANLIAVLNNVNANVIAVMARLDTLEVKFNNIAITQENHRLYDAFQAMAPRQKQVVGFGFGLALAVASSAAQTAYIQGRQAAAGATPPALGAFIIPFNPDMNNLSFNEISDIVVFYNEGLNIVIGDTLANRREKVRRWLMRAV